MTYEEIEKIQEDAGDSHVMMFDEAFQRTAIRLLAEIALQLQTANLRDSFK